MNTLPDFNEYFSPELVARFAEVQQPRSDFQLEKFIISPEGIPEMEYRQCLLELSNLYYALKTSSLKLKQQEIRVSKLKESDDPIDHLEAEIGELEIEQAKVSAVGAIRELETLLKILDRYPRYTRKELDDVQPEYWHRRLERQFHLTQIGGNNTGNLEALINIGKAEISLENPSQPMISIENKNNKIAAQDSRKELE
jgi:hypothetical protein